MSTPAQTLSIVVPIHNAERTLARHVAELLDVLPDLAARFEVVIVDDGSTDQSVDVALELAQCYPQVSVHRHPQRRGLEASAETGVARTSGDVVLVHSGSSPINTSELQRMWQLRDDQDLVLAHSAAAAGAVAPETLRKLADWGQRMTDAPTEHTAHDGIQMIRRRAAGAPPVARGTSSSHPVGRTAVPAPSSRFFAAPNSRSVSQ